MAGGLALISNPNSDPNLNPNSNPESNDRLRQTAATTTIWDITQMPTDGSRRRSVTSLKPYLNLNLNLDLYLALDVNPNPKP